MDNWTGDSSIRTKVNNRAWLLVCSLFMTIVVGCKRESISPPQVPDNLKVPDGQVVLLKALGKGVQIYICKARADDPSKFEWSFKAPEADLTNEH